MSIAVVGAVFVDIKGFPDNVYIPQGRNAGKVEIVHGGVGRNVVADIANLGLKPRFVSMVDESGTGEDVLRKLKSHGVNTDYVLTVPDGMGMWLAVFDETGDIVGSISKRPNMEPLVRLLEEKGDEIFSAADSIVIEIDIDQEIAGLVFAYAEKYHKPVYAVVANMSIASKRRELIRSTACFTCNEQEAEILFVTEFAGKDPEEISTELVSRVREARIPAIIVTLGSRGSVYADIHGQHGYCPAKKVKVRDTTGAGDSFFAGAAAGLTYGKTLAEAVEIGTRLAASVITSSENVCPRFLPKEFGIEV